MQTPSSPPAQAWPGLCIRVRRLHSELGCGFREGRLVCVVLICMHAPGLHRTLPFQVQKPGEPFFFYTQPSLHAPTPPAPPSPQLSLSLTAFLFESENYTLPSENVTQTSKGSKALETRKARLPQRRCFAPGCGFLAARGGRRRGSGYF